MNLYLTVFIFGIIAQFPTAIVSFIPGVWMADNNISKTYIGLAGIGMFPFSIEVVLTMIMTSIKIPILTKTLGRTRSWLILCQIMIGLASVTLSYIDPKNIAIMLSVITFMGVFCACNHALFYIYYSKRKDENAGFAYAVTVFTTGCRIGYLLSQNTIIRIGSNLKLGWTLAFRSVLIYTIFSIIIILFMNEEQEIEIKQEKIKSTDMVQWIKNTIADIPSLLKKIIFNPSHAKFWYLLLVSAATFKVSDAMIRKMIPSFCAEKHIPKNELLNIIVNIGTVSTILGGIIASRFVSANSSLHSLFLTAGLTHTLPCTLYMLMSINGGEHYRTYLSPVTIVDGFAAGFLTTIFSCIAHKIGKGNSTKYSAVWSFQSIAATVFKLSSGWLSSVLGWRDFFIFLQLLNVISITSTYLLAKIIKSEENKKLQLESQ